MMTALAACRQPVVNFALIWLRGVDCTASAFHALIDYRGADPGIVYGVFPSNE